MGDGRDFLPILEILALEIRSFQSRAADFTLCYFVTTQLWTLNSAPVRTNSPLRKTTSDQLGETFNRKFSGSSSRFKNDSTSFSLPNFGVAECSKKRDSGFDPVGLVDQDFQNGEEKSWTGKMYFGTRSSAFDFRACEVVFCSCFQNTEKGGPFRFQFLGKKASVALAEPQDSQKRSHMYFDKAGRKSRLKCFFFKLNKNKQKRIRRIAASMKTQKILELR